MRIDVDHMDELWQHVENADLVTSRLGLTPSLHDAEILGITLSRDGPPSATLTLKAVPYDPTGRGGTYLFTLLFKSVAKVSLKHFNEQNVIWGLYVKLEGNEKLLVIQPIYGVEGGFSFCEAIVLDASTLRAEQP